jgi:hypothetical protein
MKKFSYKSILFLVYFVLFFITINALYAIVIALTDYDVRKRLQTLRFNEPDFEIIAFGASTMFDAFDAELLNSQGIKAYNFALGGNSVKGNIIQLEEYLKICDVKPHTVLLGLNSQMVITFDEETVNPIVEVISPDHEFSLQDVPILRFKWLGFELLKKIVSLDCKNARLSYGQLRITQSKPDYSEYKDMCLDVREFETSYWIGKMAEVCHTNGIELIVLEMPGYRETQNLTPIGPYLLDNEGNYSFKLYNLANRKYCEIYESQNDWLGNSHLNETGAIKFTMSLMDLLKLKDKPDDILVGRNSCSNN